MSARVSTELCHRQGPALQCADALRNGAGGSQSYTCLRRARPRGICTARLDVTGTAQRYRVERSDPRTDEMPEATSR